MALCPNPQEYFMSNDGYRTHELSVIRKVTVYQPGVQLRAVAVFFTPKGEEREEELVVLGCQVRIVDHYDIQVHEHQRPPRTAPSGRDILTAGYRFSHRSERHNVLIWSAEYKCPVPVFDEHIGFPSSQVVMGPATLPEAWWTARLSECHEALRKWRLAELAKSTPGSGVDSGPGTFP